MKRYALLVLASVISFSMLAMDGDVFSGTQKDQQKQEVLKDSTPTQMPASWEFLLGKKLTKIKDEKLCTAVIDAFKGKTFNAVPLAMHFVGNYKARLKKSLPACVQAFQALAVKAEKSDEEKAYLQAVSFKQKDTKKGSDPEQEPVVDIGGLREHMLKKEEPRVQNFVATSDTLKDSRHKQLSPESKMLVEAFQHRNFHVKTDVLAKHYGEKAVRSLSLSVQVFKTLHDDPRNEFDKSIISAFKTKPMDGNKLGALLDTDQVKKAVVTHLLSKHAQAFLKYERSIGNNGNGVVQAFGLDFDNRPVIKSDKLLSGMPEFIRAYSYFIGVGSPLEGKEILALKKAFYYDETKEEFQINRKALSTLNPSSKLGTLVKSGLLLLGGGVLGVVGQRKLSGRPQLMPKK